MEFEQGIPILIIIVSFYKKKFDSFIRKSLLIKEVKGS